MRARLLLLALTLGAAGAVLRAQDVPSSLVLVATAGDYPGETYTEGPAAPAEFVFFEGEPVTVDVSVANWGTASAGVRLPDAAVPAVRAAILRDGRPGTPGQLQERLWRETVDGSRVVTPTSAMRVEPGDALRWRVIIGTTGLVPDFYTVQIQLAVSGEGDMAVRRHRPEFTFELRARSRAMPAELARRVAEQLTADGDVAGARAATEILERIYPDSVAVHLIRSRLAEAEGNEGLARRELTIAAGYLRADRDTLFRHYARPGQIEDLIDSLRF